MAVVRFERRTSASDRWVVVHISVRAPVEDTVPANNLQSVTTQVIGGRR